MGVLLHGNGSAIPMQCPNCSGNMDRIKALEEVLFEVATLAADVDGGWATDDLNLIIDHCNNAIQAEEVPDQTTGRPSTGPQGGDDE